MRIENINNENQSKETQLNKLANELETVSNSKSSIKDELKKIRDRLMDRGGHMLEELEDRSDSGV